MFTVNNNYAGFQAWLYLLFTHLDGTLPSSEKVSQLSHHGLFRGFFTQKPAACLGMWASSLLTDCSSWALGSSLKRQDQQPQEEHLLPPFRWDRTKAAFCRQGGSLNPCALVTLLSGRWGLIQRLQLPTLSTVSFLPSLSQGHPLGSQALGSSLPCIESSVVENGNIAAFNDLYM